MDSNMVQECGEDIKEILIKVNGDLVKLKDMVFILGQMEINIKDNLSNA